MAEFTIPEFLENYDTDDIYETMRGILPEDIDSSEGSHTWNFLMPTALTLAELYEVVLPEVIQLIFPEWSYGEFLDAHAQTRGMTRKPAVAATGQVTFTGAQGTVIPQGTMVSTASLNSDDPAITYETIEEVTIPGTETDPETETEEEEETTGSVTAEIVCTEAGAAGNTPVDTIIFLASDVSEITAVTNEAAVTGGIDEETDEELIERIMEYDQTQGDSFVGNVSDYNRWAMSVTGVGSATIIPASDSSGVVTIVLTDSNGDPASVDLCEAVYNYIMSPDDPIERLAPINAQVNVVSPTPTIVYVKATVELTAEAVMEDVVAAFLTNMTDYMPEAQEDQEIKYTRVAAILSGTDGINDFADMQIAISTDGGSSTTEYGEENIQISADDLPTISAASITLTEGTVGEAS